jgi:Icc protein
VARRRSPPTVSLFAVEDDAAQFIMREPQSVRAVDVAGLEPDRRQRVDVAGRAASVRTLAPPPGRLLSKLATLSDLHLGMVRHFRVLDDAPPRLAHPVHCTRAALAEALAWGADRIVIKGDLTHRSHPDEWKVLAELLDEVPVPVHVLVGNHETMNYRRVDPREKLAELGLPYVEVSWFDLAGLRLVLVDTTTEHGFGTLRGVHEQAVEAVATAPGPALVLLHHYLERWPVPTFYPFGVPRPQAIHWLDALRAANPDVFVSSGHSHRNRARRYHGIQITEVGSVKDYPGVWAGYAIHEGGIRQVVRRIAAPHSLEWTERSGAALGGLWRRWTPGTLAQRCFTHRWTTARVLTRA